MTSEIYFKREILVQGPVLINNSMHDGGVRLITMIRHIIAYHTGTCFLYRYGHTGTGLLVQVYRGTVQ